jgi:N-acetylmuramoyl-L-alanine amidase
MNKKIITAVAVTAAAASMSAAYAKDITVSVNGKNVDFDQPPVIDNDRTLVPMRAIFEALGATVDWDGDTRTVTSTKGDTTIKLTIDSADMYVGEKLVTLDVPAKIISDRTMVPVRAISEAMACKVDWDGENQAVIITTAAATEAPAATVAPEPSAAPETSAAPEATAAPTSSGTSSSSTSSVVSTEAIAAKEGVNTYVPALSVGKIDTTTGELDSSATEQSTTDYAPVNGGKQYFAAGYPPNVLQYTNLCKT